MKLVKYSLLVAFIMSAGIMQGYNPPATGQLVTDRFNQVDGKIEQVKQSIEQAKKEILSKLEDISKKTKGE